MWCRRGDILGANKRVEESGEEMEERRWRVRVKRRWRAERG